MVRVDMGALSEIGIDRENSMIKTLGNIEELVQKLICTIEDRELRKRINDNGYELVKKYKWEKSVQHFYGYSTF